MTKTKTDAPAADPVLGRYRQYAAVLTDTGTAIPKLLQEQRQLRQELGDLEITGADVQRTKERLDAVTGSLVSAARRRTAAAEGLLGMAGDLRTARGAAAQELAQVAQSVTNDFALRWSKACAELGRLVAEGGALGAALRTQIACPPPYIPTPSADGCRMQVSFVGHIPADAVTLPPSIRSITERIDQFDGAGALVSAIAQSRELDARYIALQRSRTGNMPVMSGLFTVIRRFDLWGAQFEPGQLVDQSLMGAGMMHRRWLARELLPAEGAAVAAA
jgi:hypothetical protein